MIEQIVCPSCKGIGGVVYVNEDSSFFIDTCCMCRGLGLIEYCF